jgi:hypothetical protein
MMMNDWSMGINIYDPLSTSENPDIYPEIEAFDGHGPGLGGTFAVILW